MKPIRLEMQAFGPYGDRQCVDFRDALDAGLFGIYGPTGSGKSSIFNAITFALFGVAAKEEQPIATLRSAHAAPTLPTEVALVFQVGAKRYLIKRQPDQLRPKARGSGDTGSAHSAWLFDVSALDIDAIDMTGCGTVLAERKVSSVAEILRTILGYGAEQFRQIVLLPQGRFERFLTANSNERLKILRELFDVSLYRKLTERLKEDAAQARREVSDGYRVHGRRLNAEGFASADELATAIEAKVIEASTCELQASTADQQLAAAEQALSRGQAIEAQFIARESADQVLATLRQQAPQIDALKAQRDQAQLAQRATDRFNAIAAMAARERHAASEVQHATATLEHSRKQLTAAQMQLASASEAAQTIDELQQNAYRLQGFEKALRDAADLKATADAAAQKLAQQELAAQAAAAKRDRFRSQLESSGAVLLAARQRGLTRAQFQNQQASVAAELATARTHHRATAELAEASTRHEAAARREVQATAAHVTAEHGAQTAENRFIAAQATLLALRLADGDPCPVCGASNHPAPAHADGDTSALEAAWKNARCEALRTDQARQLASIDAARLASLVQEREVQLASLARPSAEFRTLEAEHARIAAELAALGPSEDLNTLAAQCSQHEAGLTAASAQAEQADNGRQQARTDAAIAARSYEDQIADVPEALRVHGALSAQLQELVQAIDGRKAALSKAQIAVTQVSSNEAMHRAAHDAAERALADARTQHSDANAQFIERLAEIGISAEQFRAYTRDIASIEALTERVASHERTLRQAEGAAAQAAAQLKGLERPPLEALRATRDQAHQDALAARQAAVGAAQGHRGLVRLQDELAAELARLAQLEQQSAPLRMLAEVCTGENEASMMLETFAIGTMFDVVLDAANLRLAPMTSGRYRLERDSDTSGGRAKRGLDIRVNDIQTGRARDLSTLSGGESFIAALALALGLSDVVEASHGAIRLDTIFIDEGFGSLDTENDSGTLEVVLHALQNIVGQRRAVGLISHVPLVQQAVPNGFVILKGLAGSSVEKRVA